MWTVWAIFGLGVILSRSTPETKYLLLDTVTSVSDNLPYKLLSFIYYPSEWISTLVTLFVLFVPYAAASYEKLSDAKEGLPHGDVWDHVHPISNCWAIPRTHISILLDIIGLYGNRISPLVHLRYIHGMLPCSNFVRGIWNSSWVDNPLNFLQTNITLF